MRLTDDDRRALTTYHGNAIEVRAIRARLRDAGLKWCPKCHRARSLSAFGSRGEQMACRPCSKRRGGRWYVAVGDRDAERTARHRESHPDRVKARKKAAYWARRAAGLTGRQASYKEPVPSQIRCHSSHL